MATSIFDDPKKKPTPEEIETALGKRANLWNELVDNMTNEELLPKPDLVWKYYSKKSGWVLLAQSKRKTILTLIPNEDEIITVFLFPEKVVEETMKLRLPKKVKLAIESAEKYKMGRPFNISVTRKSDLPSVIKLTKIKVASMK